MAGTAQQNSGIVGFGVAGFAIVGLGIAAADDDSSQSNQVQVITRPTVIQRGDSLPFVFDRDGETIDDWLCTIHVKEFPDDTALITQIVVPVNRTWPGLLTSTQINLLTGGKQYFLIGELVNSVTDEKEKPVIKFYVSGKWQ